MSNKNKTIEMEVPFFQVPNDIFEIGLDKFELLVYLYLARCANNKEVAYPSLNTIAKKTSISRSTVQKAIAKLEDKAIISKKIHKKNGSRYYNNTYQVSVNIKKGMFSHGTPMVCDGIGVCSDTVTINNYIKKKDIKELYSTDSDEYRYVHFNNLPSTDIIKKINNYLDTGRTKVKAKAYYEANRLAKAIKADFEEDRLFEIVRYYKHKYPEGRSIDRLIFTIYEQEPEYKER